ncbi:hypothetical protein DAI22_03g295450 [Oryza sativa Japonica Group]|nr:hypothetical protein DAI22_03g295450 [Oryza sativa Japonica Group]
MIYCSKYIYTRPNYFARPLSSLFFFLFTLHIISKLQFCFICFFQLDSAGFMLSNLAWMGRPSAAHGDHLLQHQTRAMWIQHVRLVEMGLIDACFVLPKFYS